MKPDISLHGLRFDVGLVRIAIVFGPARRNRSTIAEFRFLLALAEWLQIHSGDWFDVDCLATVQFYVSPRTRRIAQEYSNVAVNVLEYVAIAGYVFQIGRHANLSADLQANRIRNLFPIFVLLAPPQRRLID